MWTRSKATATGIILVGLAAIYARADGPVNPPGGVATLADMAAMQATIMAAMPQPASIIPPTDTLNGAIGSSANYMRADAPRPTISQRTTVTTDASGNWTVGWAKNFNSASPVIAPTPLSAAANKPNCKVTSRSASAASGNCWMEAPTVTVLSIQVLVASVPYASASVMVIGLEPSQ